MSQVRSGSGDEATAELADGADEGNEAGIVDWFEFANFSQDLVKSVVAFGISSAQELKLLLRISQQSAQWPGWRILLQKASTTTRQFCPENSSGERRSADL